jgi:hypothetical protein
VLDIRHQKEQNQIRHETNRGTKGFARNDTHDLTLVQFTSLSLKEENMPI